MRAEPETEGTEPEKSRQSGREEGGGRHDEPSHGRKGKKRIMPNIKKDLEEGWVENRRG